MSSSILDLAYRATHEVELSVSELRTLEQGVGDLAAAFVAQIMFLGREIDRRDIFIDQLIKRLQAHGELLTDDEMDDAQEEVTAAIKAKEKKEAA